MVVVKGVVSGVEVEDVDDGRREMEGGGGGGGGNDDPDMSANGEGWGCGGGKLCLMDKALPAPSHEISSPSETSKVKTCFFYRQHPKEYPATRPKKKPYLLLLGPS